MCQHSNYIFSDNTRVKIFVYFSREARIFFPEFNIRLYDKHSESDYFFFLHQNQNIFFSNIGNQNIFFRKKTYPPGIFNTGRSFFVIVLYLILTPLRSWLPNDRDIRLLIKFLTVYTCITFHFFALALGEKVYFTLIKRFRWLLKIVYYCQKV
jgi:hypothetical protein